MAEEGGAIKVIVSDPLDFETIEKLRFILNRNVDIALAPREHTRYQWLPWREAADRCFSPSNAEAISHLPRLAAMHLT